MWRNRKGLVPKLARIAGIVRARISEPSPDNKSPTLGPARIERLVKREFRRPHRMSKPPLNRPADPLQIAVWQSSRTRHRTKGPSSSNRRMRLRLIALSVASLTISSPASSATFTCLAHMSSGDDGASCTAMALAGKITPGTLFSSNDILPACRY